jgi:hypothetical protein
MTAVTAAGKTERARENRAIVRRLLSENQPEFLAALQLAERHVDRELSGESPAGQTPGWISQVLIIRVRRAA